MSIKFIDNSEAVKAALEQAVWAGLEEGAGEIESQTKTNSRVKTGKTKNSWTHNVKSSGDNEFTATIGSPDENAIWEEFGTGDHALYGNGRKGWKGKKPSRAFFHAYTSKKNTVIRLIQRKISQALKK